MKKKTQLPALQLSRETIHPLDSQPSVAGCDTNSTVPWTLSRKVSCVQ